MQIKIVSDGTPNGTKVVNAETGELVEGVAKIMWEADAKGEVFCILKILRPEADMLVDAATIENDLSLRQ